MQAASGLSDAEVEKMQQEAEQHAAADAQLRQTVEARNTADTLAYSAEKTLRENAEKIEEPLKESVEVAIAEVREALPGDDAERIVEATEKLSAAMQEIGQAIYQQADANGASEAGADGAEPGAPPEDDTAEEAGTVEGEFREV